MIKTLTMKSNNPETFPPASPTRGHGKLYLQIFQIMSLSIEQVGFCILCKIVTYFKQTNAAVFTTNTNKNSYNTQST